MVLEPLLEGIEGGPKVGAILFLETMSNKRHILQKGYEAKYQVQYESLSCFELFGEVFDGLKMQDLRR